MNLGPDEPDGEELLSILHDPDEPDGEECARALLDSRGKNALLIPLTTLLTPLALPIF